MEPSCSGHAAPIIHPLQSTPPRQPITAKVLIADDQRAVREMVRITLATEGWAFLEADRPAAALAVAKSALPNLILLDVVFAPDSSDGLDGFDILRALKAVDSTRPIPVVMLTARDSDEDRKIAMDAGALAYLAKPFGPIDLVNTIRRILGDPPAVQTLGQYLVEEGVLTHEQVAAALRMQEDLESRGHPQRLGEILSLMHAVTPEQLRQALERQQREPRR